MGSFRTHELSDSEFESGGLRFLNVKTPNLKGRGDICFCVLGTDEKLSNLPIYVLLHGVYGSAWVWALKGGAHLTGKRLLENGDIGPCIIAMPSDGLWGDGTAYFNHNGYQYEDWIVKDVPQAIKEYIPQAGFSSKCCVAGLSMGGYGALMLGSKYPEHFAAISGHSSITKLEQMEHFVEEPLTDFSRFCIQPNVIQPMLENRGRLPAIRFDCGVDDELIYANRELHLALEANGIDHSYEEFSGGHEWAYWREHVEKTLCFFDREVNKK